MEYLIPRPKTDSKLTGAVFRHCDSTNIYSYTFAGMVTYFMLRNAPDATMCEEYNEDD